MLRRERGEHLVLASLLTASAGKKTHSDHRPAAGPAAPKGRVPLRIDERRTKQQAHIRTGASSCKLGG
jgi:hypothetical protein